MKAFLVLCSLALLVLGGCGGGGGGGGSNANPNALGSIANPEATITVDKAGAITPGTNCDFTITVTDPPASVTVTKVAACISVDYPWAGTSGTTASSTGSGGYTVTLPIASPLPANSHLWVQVTFSDGVVIESGLDDFPLD